MEYERNRFIVKDKLLSEKDEKRRTNKGDSFK
jgi:hypothetical protein